jgi:hypothetical protein
MAAFFERGCPDLELAPNEKRAKSWLERAEKARGEAAEVAPVPPADDDP